LSKACARKVKKLFHMHTKKCLPKNFRHSKINIMKSLINSEMNFWLTWLICARSVSKILLEIPLQTISILFQDRETAANHQEELILEWFLVIIYSLVYLLLRKSELLANSNIMKKVMPWLVNNSEKRLASILRCGMKLMVNIIFNSKMKRDLNKLEKN